MDKQLFRYEGVTKVFIFISCLTVIEAASIIFQAKSLAQTLFLLFSRKPIESVYPFIGQFLFAFLVRYVSILVKKRLAYHFAEKTGTTIRKQLLEKLFLLGHRFTKTEGTGNLVTLVIEGITKLRVYLEKIIPRMVATMIIPPMILSYVFFQDKISAIILMVTVPILIAFLILLGLAAKKKMNDQWEWYHVLSNHFVDSLRGLETLKSLGLSKKHGETIGKVSNEYRKATMQTLRVAFLSSFALDFFTMLSVASVAVGLGLRLIKGELMLDTALVVLILAPEYFLPIREVGADYHATLDGKEAGAAIQKIIAERIEIVNEPKTFQNGWNEDCTLKLTGLFFQHKNSDRETLKEISFQVKGFEKIGIIGESGAGKTTLIEILGGFLSPTKGKIEINGQETSTLSFANWRKQITYIPQHPYLFSESLAENIRFYQKDASREEIQKAFEFAGLNNLIQQLPNGLDEKIGNGGRTLSGGQEQRVALARAFLGNRPILLFDEPTAHLDIETEYELKETMLKLFQNRLVFFATHRLHWMQHMDRVIVLKDGKIVEMGTPEELLRKKGEYYSLVRSQMEGIQ